MASYKVEICGVNTAKLPILKEEEKDALFARIKQGDNAARETYIKGNLRLVLSVIKRFSGNHENVDDLFQIGCIGLIKSIDNFDPTIGVKFSTYAVPMIIGEIRRYLRDNNSIRVSRSLRDTAYKAIHKKRFSQNLKTKNRLLTKSQPNPAFPKRILSLPSMPYKARSVFMIRSILTAVTHSMSWIRSVTKRTGKKTGLKNYP